MRIFLSGICLCIALLSISIHAQQKSPSILYIQFAGTDSELYKDVYEGLRVKLDEQLPNATVFIEFLDFKRFTDAEFRRSTISLIYEKYRNANVDVLIFDAVEAKQTFLNAYPEWMRNKQIFSILPFSQEQIETSRDVGIQQYLSLNLRYLDTLEMAQSLTLEPNVIVVHQKDYAPLVQRYTPATSSKIQPQNMSELILALDKLPANRPVVLMPIWLEQNGRFFDPVSVANRLSLVVKQPIFVTFESMITGSVVGGYVATSESIANMLTRQIVISLGKSVDIDYTQLNYRPVVDLSNAELQRLNEASFASNTEFLNQPTTILARFFNQIVILTILVTLSFGIFLFLAYSNRRMRVKQLELASSKERLKRSNDRVDAATQATQIGIWEYDLENNVLHWDEQMYQHHYLTPDTFTHNLQDWLLVMNIEGKFEFEEKLKQGLVSGKSFKVQYFVFDKLETRHYLDCNVSFTRDNEGQITRLVGTVFDVSESVKYQSKLKQQRQKAELATKAKSEFLANMSHEIRTPMNGVIGAADLLQNTELEQSQARYVNMIKSSATGLLTILNDILDLSKIESGKLEIRMQPLSIHDLVQQTLSTFALEISRKNLRLKLVKAPNLPNDVLSDETRIKQVLFNLIGNAIKFTEKGKITLDVQYDEDFRFENRGKLSFTVKDTGIGISKKHQAKIFDSFEQVTDLNTVSARGTGLGLSISKKLAHLMGGDLTLISEKGEGSAFTLSIPVDVLEDQSHSRLPERSDDVPDLSNLTILVVDDNEINRTILGQMLEDTKAKVIYAEDGIDALDKEAENRVDIIFMDLLMPRMDGIQATTAIRNRNTDNNKPIPKIVALTAHALKGYEDNCLQSGMDKYLTKPVKRQEVYTACVDFLIDSKV